jgi:hypothetical protein
MNLIEALQGGRFEFYEVGGSGGVYRCLDAAKEALIRLAKVGLARRAKEALSKEKERAP